MSTILGAEKSGLPVEDRRNNGVGFPKACAEGNPQKSAPRLRGPPSLEEQSGCIPRVMEMTVDNGSGRDNCSFVKWNQGARVC